MNAQLNILYNQLVVAFRQGVQQIGEGIQRTLLRGRESLRRMTRLLFPGISRILDNPPAKNKDEEK